MPSEHFVGRQEAVGLLGAVLKGSTKAQGKLTIQRIEGSGGIGKSCLFDHVLVSSDLTDRYYFCLKIDGNDPSASGLVRSISRMVESAEAEAMQEIQHDKGMAKACHREADPQSQ